MKAKQNENSFENKRDDELSSYQDDYIEMSSKGLKVFKYYFPLMKCKEIPISKIKKINLIQLTMLNGRLRLAGLTWKLIYFPFDLSRCCKTKAITIKAENCCFTIGITPNDPEKCFKVLKYLMAQDENNKVLSQDNEKDSLKMEKKQ